MTISTRQALAANFSEYCRTLLKFQEECKDTLLPSEEDFFREHIRKLQETGLSYREGTNLGFGNTIYLRLKPGTGLADAELNLDRIHPGFSDQTLSGIVDGLARAIQTLSGYCEPEPNVCVLKPHDGKPNYRHLTYEWIRWYKQRHPDQPSIRQIAMIGGERIHEMMVKEGTSPLRQGNQLKVLVNIDDSIWDGNDVPVGLWYTSTQEF